MMGLKYLGTYHHLQKWKRLLDKSHTNHYVFQCTRKYGDGINN